MSLNEGRSISSGDTVAGTARSATAAAAQRRPEHKLRRHLLRRGDGQQIRDPLNEGRSISSGDTPEPLERERRPKSAQRRPEHKLRRHT